MRVSRRQWDGSDAAGLAASLRAAVPAPEAIAADVAALIADVRDRGDEAVLEFGERFDGGRPKALRVDAGRAEAALAEIDSELLAALRIAARNIHAVAEGQLAGYSPATIMPGQGQGITVSEVAVGAAGIYVPGGRAPYPSTALMGAIPARVAGVERVVVATPVSAAVGGIEPHPAVLAACAVAGVDEIYAMGGAQAIAALAFGTDSVAAVDVIAGPGGPWVQEAKLAVSRWTGIDGYAGPSELVVLADAAAPARWLALDLCAQAEHGADGMLVAICTDAAVAESIAAEVEAIAADSPSVSDAPLELILVSEVEAGLALAEALAPEHLQICCADAAGLARGVRRAGAVFTGPLGATAFGDYAAGSNHVLPTGGAGRFTGPLGPASFRRRISVVEMDPASAVELGGTVETIARAEGFDVHGASAKARGESPSTDNQN
jgi:histidinol dehydrogenase